MFEKWLTTEEARTAIGWCVLGEVHKALRAAYEAGQGKKMLCRPQKVTLELHTGETIDSAIKMSRYIALYFDCPVTFDFSGVGVTMYKDTGADAVKEYIGVRMKQNAKGGE